MEDIKYGPFIGELLSTKRQPRLRQGIYTAELITTKRQPRVRDGVGVNTIIKEIIIENDNNELQTPRAFPLEYSWTKNK